MKDWSHRIETTFSKLTGRWYHHVTALAREIRAEVRLATSESHSERERCALSFLWLDDGNEDSIFNCIDR